MAIHADNPHLPDDVPIGDAVEQQQPVDADTEDGLDRDHLADPLQREANTIDVIDQAIIVAWPDDDRDAATTSSPPDRGGKSGPRGPVMEFPRATRSVPTSGAAPRASGPGGVWHRAGESAKVGGAQ